MKFGKFRTSLGVLAVALPLLMGGAAAVAQTPAAAPPAATTTAPAATPPAATPAPAAAAPAAAAPAAPAKPPAYNSGDTAWMLTSTAWC